MADPLPESWRGPGLRVRFARIRGVTAKGVLTEALYLPVLLGEFAVEEEFSWADYDTVAAGEFSIPSAGPATARRLRTTDLQTMTIDWHAYARFLVNPHISPAAAQREVLKLGRARTPFEILATLRLGSGPEELRMKASLRGVQRVLRPGEADTRYYTLSVKEWRDNGVGRREAGSRGGQGRHGHHLPTSHKLTASDTLRSLARHYYGSPNVWRAIAQANKIRGWGADTPLVKSRRFKVGDKVTIPLKPRGTRFLGGEDLGGRTRQIDVFPGTRIR